MAQAHILPLSLAKIQKKQHPLKKMDKEAQLVSNFATHIPPEVAKLAQTSGNILNPHEVYKTSVVSYLGGESVIDDLETWRQPGKQIPDMSAEQLTSQEDREKLYNSANSPKFEACGEIHTKSVSAEKENCTISSQNF